MSAPKNHSIGRKTFVAVAGVFAVLYLINPTLGLFEFLPDNIPLFGNLDESTATLILLSALAYYGYRIPNMFNRDDEDNSAKSNKTPASEHKNSEGVIEGEIIRE